MRITAIREIAVPIRSSLRNAVFDFSQMTTSVVAIETDVIRGGKPVRGYAFNSTGRYACGAVMRDRLIPRLMAAAPEALLDDAGTNFDAERALAVMMKGEKPGGHTERSVPVGTIEVALWDVIGKINDEPTAAAIARRYRGAPHDQRLFCYVGGGWYKPGGVVADLTEEVKRHLDAGYTLVKVKVGGLPLAQDMERLEAAVALVGGGQNLAVDANCGMSPAVALEYAAAMAPLGLRWFEEPVDPGDFEALAAIAEVYPHGLATGENLFSTQDVVNLARYGGLSPERGDIIQTDTPQSYGIATLARTLKAIAPYGWTAERVLPHGGNLMSLHIAAGFGQGMCEAYPGVFGVFAGYADDSRVENGFLDVPDRPGIGFEAQSELYAIMRQI